MTLLPATRTDISTKEYLALFTLTSGCTAIIIAAFRSRGEPIVASLGFSGFAFAATYCLIPWLGDAFKKVGFKGKDMAKTHRPEIPETMGAVCAVVYIMCMFLFIPFPFYEYLVQTSGGGNRDVEFEVQQSVIGRTLHRFPHNKLGEYLSAILSLQSMVFLGVADDLFDIRWRHKILLPAIAAIPMLVVYYVDFGVTVISIPTVLQPYLGRLLNLGWLYYAYMAFVAILGPNAINILAGINGIEVGQSIVIALMIIFNDILYISQPGHPAMNSHLFSLYFLLPFLGVSLALLRYNWFPAKVFVGDTYCYFAGFLFSVVGILGHFSKTLMLLLLPQIFNGCYSTPQLFGLIPCPRHRLPKFNARTHLLEPSMAQFLQPPKKVTVVLLTVMEKFKVVKLVRDEERVIKECSNLTILNLWLVWFGTMREDTLALGVMGFQLAMGLLALGIRHGLALMVYEYDNLVKWDRA
ncbi:tunicamycin resistance protein [Arthrobotrys conoides]|uniref:UDP-N-acetylglucosamine--dolichyl-phosphate N-acetylglucosaminephosphotransferase n=1 Tax=Arthrobotrys conoides TaxID=74498 RepID=A0AAN8RRM1_9PEZI